MRLTLDGIQVMKMEIANSTATLVYAHFILSMLFGRARILDRLVATGVVWSGDDIVIEYRFKFAYISPSRVYIGNG